MQLSGHVHQYLSPRSEQVDIERRKDVQHQEGKSTPVQYWKDFDRSRHSIHERKQYRCIFDKMRLVVIVLIWYSITTVRSA